MPLFHLLDMDDLIFAINEGILYRLVQGGLVPLLGWRGSSTSFSISIKATAYS
jgi:hypothetical protein